MLRVRGRVRDARGRPLPGARLAWVAAPVAMPDVALIADALGRFAFTLAAPGDYLLQAASDDGRSARAAIRFAQPGTLELDLRIAD